MDKEKKEFSKWWILVLCLVVSSSVILTVLNYVGVIGRTVVEREVFENSYQYTSGQRARANMMNAQLTEIGIQLSNTELDQTTRKNLEAQAAAIRVQLNTIGR
jgi:hypothetical protein